LIKYQKELVLNGTDLHGIAVKAYNALQCREGQYGEIDVKAYVFGRWALLKGGCRSNTVKIAESKVTCS
jgi:hypothetical protein